MNSYLGSKYNVIRNRLWVRSSSLEQYFSVDKYFSLTPWVTNMGYQRAFILAAFAGLAQVLTFLIFVKWGKKWRRMSTDRYLKYVQEISNAGLSH